MDTLGIGTFIEFYEPSHNLVSSCLIAAHKEAAWEPRQSGVIYITSN